MKERGEHISSDCLIDSFACLDVSNARTRKSSEPDGASLLARQTHALFGRNAACMPCDVGSHDDVLGFSRFKV